MDDAKLKLYVELKKTKTELEAQLEALSGDMTQLEKDLLDQFAAAGMQRCRVNGMTVYLSRTLWAGAKDGDKDRLCAALKECGYGDLVKVQTTVNTNSLSSLIREMDQEGAEMPEQLREAVKVTEQFQLKVVKGN